MRRRKDTDRDWRKPSTRFADMFANKHQADLRLILRLLQGNADIIRGELSRPYIGNEESRFRIPTKIFNILIKYKYLIKRGKTSYILNPDSDHQELMEYAMANHRHKNKDKPTKEETLF